jgi:predicted ATP-grasp superfamily ATP-dependent carboligase
MSAARVLVTDAGRGSAIAVIRSLGRQGLHVTAADHDRHSAGFRSRYAAARLVYPDPAADPAAVVDLLHAHAAADRVDLIIPVTDELLLPLARERSRFAGLSALAIPEDDALAQVVDKRATIELARRLGVPVPRTVLVHSVEEALAAARGLGWPLVLKPVASRVLRAGEIERFEVSYANTASALAAGIRQLEGRCAVLLQEYRAGETHGVELLAERGQILMAFQHRRLHELPITGGASSLREGVALDPELLSHASRLMRELRYTGLAMVEFRVGDGGPALMEVNGRIWGSLPLAVKSGVDFPLGLAAIYLGSRLHGSGPGASSSETVGLRSRDLGRELAWIASVGRRRRRYPFLPAPPRRAALAAALRLAVPKDGFDLVSRDDPAPALVDAAHAACRLMRKAAHVR